MAGRAYFSSSTLAEAVQRQRLPSQQVVEAFAGACDADPAEWVAKWRTASAQLAGGDRYGPSAGSFTAVAPVTASGATDATDSALARTSMEHPPLALSRADTGLVPSADIPAPRRRWRSWLAGTVAAFLVVVTAIWLLAYPGNGTTRGMTSSVQPIADGQDPYVHGCGRDQQPMERQPIYWADGKLYGWVVLYVSVSCSAAWGYVLGPNSPQWRVNIMAHRLDDNAEAPSSFRGHARPNSWGNALSTRTGCVRAEAWVSNGPRAITSCWRMDGPVVRSPRPVLQLSRGLSASVGASPAARRPGRRRRPDQDGDRGAATHPVIVHLIRPPTPTLMTGWPGTAVRCAVPGPCRDQHRLDTSRQDAGGDATEHSVSLSHPACRRQPRPITYRIAPPQ